MNLQKNLILQCYVIEKKGVSETESISVLNTKNKINNDQGDECKINGQQGITNDEENETVILNEILNNSDYDDNKSDNINEKHTESHANICNNTSHKINFDNIIYEDKNEKNLENRTLISCTLHESLYDFCHAKVTHTNLKSRLPNNRYNNKEKPRNTLVFQTVMLDGEPCTTRYKTTEPHLIKSKRSEKLNNKMAEEIKSSDIKLVFSHDVLEYLTKSFLHDKDNNLNRDKNKSNDLVVCTLFPKQMESTNEKSVSDMDIDTNSSETNRTKMMMNSYMIHDSMDIDDSCSNSLSNSVSLLCSENNSIFNDTELSPRSECKLVLTNPTVNIHPSMSKSSPHMPQQSSNNNNNKEITRLRRNLSKKVSWKENVEVCFINHSSKSANEILQEVQPLIDHEVYWRDCVGEMDRKRREKWLKIRAVEQRCLTGDGQFHDYFACRMHNAEEE